MDQANFVANHLTQTWQELADYLLQHPDQLAVSQMNYWQAYLNLCQEFNNEPQKHNDERIKIDKRFQHEDWQKKIIFNFLQRSYQLLAQHTENFSRNPDIANNQAAKKLGFYSKQFIDLISPSNFLYTNPEVLEKTFNTNADNLQAGFKKFLDDLKNGNGLLKIKNTDLSHFELGKNVACTPGHVIYQNELMQLIEYTPRTGKVYEVPLLIIPPWINKYYILDLQQENSLVKWLVEQGHQVYMISWVNPDSRHKHITFFDYLDQGAIAALKTINKATNQEHVNLLGYCIGGTLLGCLLAYLAKKRLNIKVSSATFLTTLFDFSQPGELGAFIDEQQITMLENYMEKNGYLDGNIMSSVFSALRANDLIWSAFVNQYLKGQKPKPFDLLFWNADITNVPAPTHRFYLRNMYLENKLIQPNAISMNKTALDLGRINTPSYFLAAHDDHIIPWQASYKSHLYIKSAKFVLTASGHVAGVVNPPQQQKYGYWTCNSTPSNPESFLAASAFHQGSWWVHWHDWLASYAGKMINVPMKKQPVVSAAIEPAPGSYVRMKCET